MLIVDQELCLECGGCVPICPEEALFLSFDCLEIDKDLCNECGICADYCPIGAFGETDAVEV